MNSRRTLLTTRFYLCLVFLLLFYGISYSQAVDSPTPLISGQCKLYEKTKRWERELGSCFSFGNVAVNQKPYTPIDVTTYMNCGGGTSKGELTVARAPVCFTYIVTRGKGVKVDLPQDILLNEGTHKVQIDVDWCTDVRLLFYLPIHDNADQLLCKCPSNRQCNTQCCSESEKCVNGECVNICKEDQIFENGKCVQLKCKDNMFAQKGTCVCKSDSTSSLDGKCCTNPAQPKYCSNRGSRGQCCDVNCETCEGPPQFIGPKEKVPSKKGPINKATPPQRRVPHS